MGIGDWGLGIGDWGLGFSQHIEKFPNKVLGALIFCFFLNFFSLKCNLLCFFSFLWFSFIISYFYKTNFIIINLFSIKKF